MNKNEKERIQKVYENSILEASWIIRTYNSARELKSMYGKLSGMATNFRALDNEVGGTSMINDIEKDHSKLMSALNDFFHTVRSAIEEYKKLK